MSQDIVPKNIAATTLQLIDEFAKISSWEDRYRRIIQMGRALPDMPETLKIDDNKVRGCQAQVWMVAQFKDGRIYFQADSDATIVKGLIAMLLQVYSNRSPEEILNQPPDFVEKIGLNTNLSQTRSNGLVAMIKQIKFYALGFQALRVIKK